MVEHALKEGIPCATDVGVPASTRERKIHRMACGPETPALQEATLRNMWRGLQSGGRNIDLCSTCAYTSPASSLNRGQDVRKVLSILVAGCLVLSLCMGIIVPVPTARADTDGVWGYSVVGGNATITGCSGPGGAVVIPGTLGTYAVTSIGPAAPV